MNGHGTREAFVEALAGRLAHHARAVRWDVAEQIRAALRNAGVVGDRIDAGHLVGALPPGVGGLPAPVEITDDAGVVLVDDDGVELVTETGAASADHVHAGTRGVHEEFLPAAAATTVTLAAAPVVVMMVARNGVVQSVASGHYSVAGAVVTFSVSFDGTQRVVVSYEV